MNTLYLYLNRFLAVSLGIAMLTVLACNSALKTDGESVTITFGSPNMLAYALPLKSLQQPKGN